MPCYVVTCSTQKNATSRDGTGGVLQNVAGAKLSIAHVTFDYSSAGDGGIIYNSKNSILHVTNSQFLRGNATQFSGHVTYHVTLLVT